MRRARWPKFNSDAARPHQPGAGTLPLSVVTDVDTASPRTHYIHTDHLGTPELITQADKTVAWNPTLTPFGELVSVAGTLGFDLRLPGQYADAESNLHQNWHRDYDPALGRYMQADPIGLAGGTNLYGYAYANPVSYIDPTGEVVPLVPLALGAGGVAIGTLVGAVANYLGNCSPPPLGSSDYRVAERCRGS